MINIKSVKELYDKNTSSMQAEGLISEALEIFDLSKSSAIVIINDKKCPIGILTERDIIKHAGHWDTIISLPVTEVMSSHLTTIDKEHDFRDAYMQMSENGFRHLIVTKKDGSLAGILDEGHFLRHLTPEQLLGIKEVKLVMSKNVTTVETTNSVAETIKLMRASNISSIIIVHDQKPLGIFTERDTIRLARHGDTRLKEAIFKNMTSPLKTIHEGTSVIDAEQMLTQEHIRHLIVVNNEGELSGVVSQHDLVKGISGIYVELLRNTIRKQSNLLYDTYNRLEEQSVLENILNSFSDKLIMACDVNSIVRFTNNVVFHNQFLLPNKGQKLDENVQYFDSSISKMILDGEITSIIHSELLVYDLNAKRHYFKTSYAPLFSKQKLLQGFLFTAEDITSEKQSLIELEKTKELLEKQNLLLLEQEEQLLQYRHIVSATTDFIVFIDKKYKYIAVNDAYISYHKKNRKEIVNASVADVIGQANFQTIKPYLDEAFQGTELTLELNAFADVNGHKKYEEIRFYPYKNKHGSTEGVVLNIRDNSEKQIALQNEKKLLDLIDSSSNEIYVFDKESLRFKYANDGALSNLQYTRQELQTMHPYDIKPEYSKKIFVDSIQPLLQKKISKLVFQTQQRRKDSTIYPIEVNLQLLKTLDDSEEFLAIVSDITERKKIEAKLKQQEEMMIIQSRQAAMGEMINMIAHQWRQPLSVVTMIINNLLLDIQTDMFDTTVAQKDFSEINDQLQYMSATIDDFRNFFKHSKEIERDSVDNILQDILKIIGPALNSNGIKVEVECDSKLMIQTYKSELKQVIINILSNAKDALKEIHREQKIIKIFVKSENEYILFSIFNNGPQIDSRPLQKIFEPYFTTKEIIGGTGIGLYMSKAIIDKHMHGNIDVKNVNQWVEFTITVPKILKGGVNE